MPQEFQVLRCYSCCTFQVHQVKKILKFNCKVCGEKQSVKKVYGRGTGADCRKHVQKCNMLRCEQDQAAEHLSYGLPGQSDNTQITDNRQMASSDCSKWQAYLDQPSEDVDFDPADNYTTDRHQFDQTKKDFKKAARQKWQERRSQKYQVNDSPVSCQYGTQSRITSIKSHSTGEPNSTKQNVLQKENVGRFDSITASLNCRTEDHNVETNAISRLSTPSVKTDATVIENQSIKFNINSHSRTNNVQNYSGTHIQDDQGSVNVQQAPSCEPAITSIQILESQNSTLDFSKSHKKITQQKQSKWSAFLQPENYSESDDDED